MRQHLTFLYWGGGASESTEWRTCVIDTLRVLERQVWIRVGAARDVEERLDRVVDGAVSVAEPRLDVTVAAGGRRVGGEVVEERQALTTAAAVRCAQRQQRR